MSDISKAYHSITFGEKNTWENWRLVPMTRPVFNPPKPKYKTVEVPGGDGVIDVSELLTGYPVYNNREGSFEFLVMNGYREWFIAYSDIMDYLHGQKLRAVLEDDPDYFYEGKFSVNQWKSDKHYSLITIDYSVSPYKQSVLSTMDEWLWDPFDFRTGIALTRAFKNIKVTNEYQPCRFRDDVIGRAPICPTFDIKTETGGGIYIHFVNEHLGIDIEKHAPDGRRRYPEFVFRGKSPVAFALASSRRSCPFGRVLILLIKSELLRLFTSVSEVLIESPSVNLQSSGEFKGISSLVAVNHASNR